MKKYKEIISGFDSQFWNIKLKCGNLKKILFKNAFSIPSEFSQ
jgi:hypothetical protein